MTPTRKTPIVDGLPVPWWDLDLFELWNGEWWFRPPDIEIVIIDLRQPGKWRKTIAAVAELAWRKRAERWDSIRGKIEYHIGHVALLFTDGEMRQLSRRGNAAIARYKEATRAVAACRKWGEKR